MASNDTLAVFLPDMNEPPASGMATIDWRNNHPVLDFDPAATETAIFTVLMPNHYSGGGITVRWIWAASTATANVAVLESAFERGDTDLDADSFATAVQSTGTANGTSGIRTITTFAHTSGQIDGIVAGDNFRWRGQRIGGSGSDTMAGDLELVAVELRET